MPELRVEVDPDVAEALGTETSLLGFDSEEAYLAWIVENRAAIEQGTESAELLAKYRHRLAALEAALSEAGVDPASVDGDAVLEGVIEERVEDAVAHPDPADDSDESSEEALEPPADGSGTAASHQSGATTGPAGDEAGAANVEPAADAEAGASADPAADAEAGASVERATDSEAAARAAAPSEDACGGRRSGPDVEGAATASDQTTFSAENLVYGTPPEASSAAGAAGGASVDEDDAACSSAESDATVGSDDGDAIADSAESPAASGSETAAAADVTSMHLRPERVQRINEDPVARDAGELRSVEVDRVDELSRRAVAETRKRLDRDVETGLEYESSATISEDVRPGEDLADLDAIDVPGRSDDLVERRRAVVGRALALLRDRERARRSTFVDALYEDHAAGYETADGWWRCVREGLAQVEAVDGGHVWEYAGRARETSSGTGLPR